MIIWFNPSTGVSGDMLLGALLDLGAPLDGIRRAVASTGLTGWQLDYQRERRGALIAGRAVVEVADDAPERRADELLAMVRRAQPEPVGKLAARAVTSIAEVEGALHGQDDARVHLHEIGGLDTVVDTVGVAAALHLLGVCETYCGPLPLGTGTVPTRHGRLPAPVPAAVALLASVGAEIIGSDITGETVTPTGAALLAAAGARFAPMPRLRLRRVGYGAGSRTMTDRPNVLQALLGERPATDGEGDDRLVLLETNVDDVTGEQLGHVIHRALAEGARDAWVSSIVMKKSRPAHTVHLLTAPEQVGHLEQLLFSETGTLGVRRIQTGRTVAARRVVQVTVDGHPVRITHGPYRAKPEYDDIAAAAAALNLPLREVSDRALRACLSAHSD